MEAKYQNEIVKANGVVADIITVNGSEGNIGDIIQKDNNNVAAWGPPRILSDLYTNVGPIGFDFFPAGNAVDDFTFAVQPGMMIASRGIYIDISNQQIGFPNPGAYDLTVSFTLSSSADIGELRYTVLYDDPEKPGYVVPIYFWNKISAAGDSEQKRTITTRTMVAVEEGFGDLRLTLTVIGGALSNPADANSGFLHIVKIGELPEGFTTVLI